MAIADSTQDRALAGRTILIVEDDYYVAQECANVVRREGGQVLGPVPDPEQARALVRESTPDCALLDVNLKGEFSFSLAEDILNEGIPAIFTTAYEAVFMPQWLRHVPLLMKPINMQELVALVTRQIADSQWQTTA